MTVPTRRLAASTYRSVAATFGRKALPTTLAGGLPASLEQPLRFLFDGTLSPEASHTRDLIEGRRREIGRQPHRYMFSPVATSQGMSRWLVEARANEPDPDADGRWLGAVASIPARWGLFLHLLAESLAARTIVELGSCVGISGAYLASATGCRQLLTIEGSPVLAPVAGTTLATVCTHGEVINASFDDGIETVRQRLAEDGSAIDLLYVDGHHDLEATLNYVGRFEPLLDDRAVVVLDDIYLYREMWQAWERLRCRPGLHAAVNVGRFGVLFCDRAATNPTEFDLSRYTGRWRVGGPRPAALLRS